MWEAEKGGRKEWLTFLAFVWGLLSFRHFHLVLTQGSGEM